VVEDQVEVLKEEKGSGYTTKIHSNSIHIRVISCSGYGVRRPVTIGKEGSRNIGDN
jgi:hypothetical protein